MVIDGKATLANLMDVTRFLMIVDIVSCLAAITRTFFSIKTIPFQNTLNSYLMFVPNLIFLTFGDGAESISKYRMSDRFFTRRHILTILFYIIVYFLVVVVSIILLI